jgi:predicted TIM-barrel fold metal-dependent hydrolase
VRVFDFHTHVGLGHDECDLFEVPGRDRFDAWLAAQPRPATEAVALPPGFYAWPNGLEDTARLNDLMAAWRAQGGCVAAFGVVEPHHGDAALAEIDRIAAIGLQGIAWRHRGHGVFADVPVMERFVARAARHNLVLALHASRHSGNEALWRLWGLAEACPGARFVALGAVADFEQQEELLASARRAPNLRYDLTGLRGRHELKRLVDTFGAERLLFGTGAHDTGEALAVAGHARLVTEAAIPDTAKEQILWRNAAVLLGLP